MPVTPRRCSHCGMPPADCDAKANTAAEAQRERIAQAYPNITDDQRERSVAAAGNLAKCCANCLHF